MSIRENVLKSLQALIDKEGSKAEFARKVGVSRSAVTNWTSGLNAPDIEIIAEIADKYDVQLSDILYGRIDQNTNATEYHMIDFSQKNKDHFIDVPLYGSIAAGTPLEMLPVDDMHPAPKQIVDRYPDGFWLQIASNSMDLLFPVRSLVYVDPMDDIRVNGKPYALCVNGYDATVKLVDKLSNGYKLSPASTDPTYKPQIFDYSVPGTDKVSVIGEIVYDMKPFDWSY